MCLVRGPSGAGWGEPVFAYVKLGTSERQIHPKKKVFPDVGEPIQGRRIFDFFLFQRLLWQRVEGNAASKTSVVQHRVVGEAVDKAGEAAKCQ